MDNADKLRISKLFSEEFLIWILRLGTAACFLGWAWQHLYWEGPYAVVLWKPWVFNLLERFGLDWDTIVGQGDGSGLILRFSRLIGWLLLICGISAFTVKRGSRLQMTALCLGCVCLLLAAYGKYILSLRQHAMFAEHGGQVLMALILVMAVQLGCRHRATRWLAVLAFVLTFTGHGAYAVGWAPTPGPFIGMIRIILSVPEEWALVILRIAGWLDFAVCVAVFIPFVRGPALLYAATWGALTALARPLASMGSDLIYWGADQYLHEALYRMPHVVIPLFLYGVYRKQLRVGTSTDKAREPQIASLGSHPMQNCVTE